MRRSQLVCNVHTLHPLVVVEYTWGFLQGDAIVVPLAGVRHLGRMHRGQHTDIFLVFPDQGEQPFVGGAVTNITSLELHGGQVLGHVLTIFSDRPDDVRLLAV